MNYSRVMVDLVFEIRRRVPSDFKPSVKLANPELLIELIEHVRSNRDIILHALVRELLAQAGDEWLEQLDAEPDRAVAHESLISKIYRGSVILETAPRHEPRAKRETPAAAPAAASSSAPAAPTRPQRIYRGQIIYDD